MPSEKWFSYSPEFGLEFHRTSEEARACAAEALAGERNQAREGDGWSHDVTAICWGEVRERVTETLRRTCEELGVHLDFELRSTSGGGDDNAL